MNHPDINKLICDQNKDGCTWFNGYPSMGNFVLNNTVNTYIKQAAGVVEKSTSGGSDYLHVASVDVACQQYVGWALPMDMIARECNNDGSCNGFIMKKDNSYGALCKWKPEW